MNVGCGQWFGFSVPGVPVGWPRTCLPPSGLAFERSVSPPDLLRAWLETDAEMRLVLHNVLHADQPRRANFPVMPSAVFADRRVQ
jgi:hypothetical protein